MNMGNFSLLFVLTAFPIVQIEQRFEALFE